MDSKCKIELDNKKEEVEFKVCQYEVRLPWKEGCLPQSNNYGMCVRISQSLHSELKNKPNLLTEYDIIQEQRKKGILKITPTPNEETL